ncbi:MAG: roadblock/LC7 domain-containing protein [Candidatus Hermodarchaeota archaeon]
MSIDTKSFDYILSKVLNSESGIKNVILIDRTGLTIAEISKVSYFPADDGIGAIAAAVFSAIDEQGECLELGSLQIVTSEFSEGKIFTSGCGSSAVIAIISTPDINVGLIRLILKRSIGELEQILEGFFRDDNDDDTLYYRDPRDPAGGSEGALANF